MLKSLLIALASAYLSFLGGVLPAHAYTDAEIAEFERVRDIRVGRVFQVRPLRGGLYLATAIFAI